MTLNIYSAHSMQARASTVCLTIFAPASSCSANTRLNSCSATLTSSSKKLTNTQVSSFHQNSWSSQLPLQKNLRAQSAPRMSVVHLEANQVANILQRDPIWVLLATEVGVWQATSKSKTIPMTTPMRIFTLWARATSPSTTSTTSTD